MLPTVFISHITATTSLPKYQDRTKLQMLLQCFCKLQVGRLEEGEWTDNILSHPLYLPTEPPA